MSKVVIEDEERRRFKVLLWAYAYECKADSLVSDSCFDEVCKEIDLTIDTSNPGNDKWFRENFQPYTGSWIHKYPGLPGLEKIYHSIVTARQLLG